VVQRVRRPAPGRGAGNYYARFWHHHAINRLAYGFRYDDVAEQSPFGSHGNPRFLPVAAGW
jgi:hypothetical protein